MGIAAFGLIKWFKNKENSFFLALGACGMGSIYITLFIGNAYFGIIGYLALFILVAIWTAVIIFLSKYKKILFEIIGYCGICIAVMFGTVSSISRIIFIADDIQIQESNITRFGITVVFFLIGILAFMLFGKMDTISYIVSNSASLVCAIPLLIGAGYFTYRDINSNGEYGDGVPFILIILAIFYTAMLVMNLLKTKKENGTWINLFGLCYSITLGITVNMLFHDTSVIYIVSIIVYAITVIAIETFCIKKFSREKFVSTYIWLSYLLIMIAWKIAESDLINVNVGFLIVGAAMIIYGFVFNDLFYKICGLTLNVILLGCIMDSSTILRLLSFVGMFALINVFMYVKNSQYNLPIKLISYLTFLIGIAETIGLSDIKTNPGQWIPTLILLIIGIINALAMKTAYRKNWEINEDDQGMIITGYVVNAILMCYSLFIIMFMEDPLLHWLVVLIAVALFMLNSISLFHKWDGFGAIYVGLKFTVLIVTILASFDMTDNILSIIVFLLSIILISAGFIYKVKGLRIYGLVLSLICVIKLVMIDIAYENTVGHALSFFLSGVLCFVISAIYSHVEKKYKDNETNNVLNA